ncbi:MAG TPA: GNAT family N-acetyltransferase [Bryobacteraceae bacterium]|nr:GNAT family N-acetyltransferase [Bryobacteraceae bacterium]
MSDKRREVERLPELRVERAHVSRPDDALALVEEYYEAIQVIARDNRDSLLHILSDPQSAIWVAYSGEVAIGCILFRPLTQFESAGEIKRLYVRPAYHARGVARLLLRTLEQFAQERNIAWLYLDTKDDLTEAIAFYRSHGYTPCARYNENPQATIFLRKELTSEVIVRTFRPGDEEAFRTLNEAWIEEYFHLEEKDRQTLNDPHSYVLAPGGQIFIALRNGEAVGCCALLAMGDRSWEIAKMGVSKQQRGHGIGRRLLNYVIEYAKARSYERLYIETNSRLVDAIHLYESMGFRHIPPEGIQPSPYARADVFLEMIPD